MTAVLSMAGDETLIQEILRAGPHTVNIFHQGDGCQIVGAVLYSKPETRIPAFLIAKGKRPACNVHVHPQEAPRQLKLV